MKETNPQDIPLDVNPSELKGDLNVRAIIWTTIILFGSLIVGALLMWVYFEILDSRAQQHDAGIAPMMDTAAIPPEPRLQYSDIHRTTEVEDMHVMRAREDSVLAGYAWVDRPSGTVRMPIAQAMEIIGKRGTGSRPAASAGSAAATATAPDTAAAAAPAARDTAAAAPANAPAGH